MSNKALTAIKEKLELDFIKSHSPEELNRMFNTLNDRIDRGENALKKIRDMEQPFAGEYRKVYGQMVFDMQAIATEALEPTQPPTGED
jgi:hypothetical protein